MMSMWKSTRNFLFTMQLHRWTTSAGARYQVVDLLQPSKEIKTLENASIAIIHFALLAKRDITHSSDASSTDLTFTKNLLRLSKLRTLKLGTKKLSYFLTLSI